MDWSKDVGKIFNVMYELPDRKADDCHAVLVGLVGCKSPVFVAAPGVQGFHRRFNNDNVTDIHKKAWTLLEPAMANGTAKILVLADGLACQHTYIEKSGISPEMYTVSKEEYDKLFDYAGQRVYELMPVM